MILIVSGSAIIFISFTTSFLKFQSELIAIEIVTKLYTKLENKSTTKSHFQNTKFCLNYGHKNHYSYGFCSNCGKEI